MASTADKSHVHYFILILFIGIVFFLLSLVASSTAPLFSFKSKAAELSSNTPMTASSFGYNLKYDSDGYVLIPPQQLSLIQPFTVEAWVKPEKPNDLGSIISSIWAPYGSDCRTLFNIYVIDEPSFPGKYLLASSIEGLHSAYYLPSPYISNFMTYGNWEHVAITLSNNVFKMYYNGQLKGSTNIDGSCDPGKGIVIGVQYDGQRPFNDTFYRGNIEEVRISNSVRYKSNFNPPYLPFAPDIYTGALYHFDHDFLDGSTHHNDGHPVASYHFEETNIQETH